MSQQPTVIVQGGKNTGINCMGWLIVALIIGPPILICGGCAAIALLGTGAATINEVENQRQQQEEQEARDANARADEEARQEAERQRIEQATRDKLTEREERLREHLDSRARYRYDNAVNRDDLDAWRSLIEQYEKNSGLQPPN